MAFAGFPDEAHEFYEGLVADNSKVYWTAHKATYDNAVMAPMRALIEELGGEFGEAKFFRPYRDVRFSKDKTPYKTQQGVFVEAVPGIGYYLGLNADGLMLGSGFYASARDAVARYRAAVDADGPGNALQKIVDELVSQGYEISGDRVKTRPRGVPADHPRLDLMRHESLIAGRHTEPIEGRAALDAIRDAWRDLESFVAWLTTQVGPITMSR